MAAIMSVSSLPKNEIPQFSIPHIDKAAHAAEYLILGILAIRAMLGSSFSANITAITVCVIIFASAYAVLDEWHQQFVPGRETDLVDFIADFAGINIGVFLYKNNFFMKGLNRKRV
jgi:VanZ family protein